MAHVQRVFVLHVVVVLSGEVVRLILFQFFGSWLVLCQRFLFLLVCRTFVTTRACGLLFVGFHLQSGGVGFNGYSIKIVSITILNVG